MSELLGTLDLTFLHNPRIAEGFSFLMGAVRRHSKLDPVIREIAICYVAVLNGASYEWKAHAPIALDAGLKRNALEVILKGEAGNWDLDILNEEQIDVLEFTRQSTRDIKVDTELIERLKRSLSERQVVELAMTVASYNMVSRFLVGLDITESNGTVMVMP